MWSVCFIHTDPAGNIKADKEKNTEKIGCVISYIMALDRAIRWGNDTLESVYERRGVGGGLCACYISAYIIRPIAPASFELVGSIIYLLFVTLLQ